MVHVLVAVGLQILYFSQNILCQSKSNYDKYKHNPYSVANSTFPDGFLIGSATSSYQIEGAWDVDGKGPSTWDVFTHDHPERIVDRSTGDDACKSYYKYKEDVKALKDMGMNFYRFSIAWARIMPTGHPNEINKKGIEYYNNLINELLENNITPFVTMFHWDLPQELQNLGGWTNEYIIQAFEIYARVLFENFGDRVKWWVTFNEPQFVALGYEFTKMAPGIFTYGVGPYLASHNVLKAHARVYHMYDEEFRDKQKGQISIAPNIIWGIPLNTTSKDDWDAAFEFMLFFVGWFTEPIYSERGDYPQVMKERIANNSKEQGFPQSRLPKFTKEEIDYIKGTADYFAFNGYTATLVTRNDSHVPPPSALLDSRLALYKARNWLMSNTSTWEAVTPISLRGIMNWIKGRYGQKWGLFITENGFADHGQMNDTARITYLATYMTEILKAIYIDELNVIALTIWALIDNFEWADGYTSKWGLYHVDFNDPERKRTPKQSSYFATDVINTRRVPEKYVPMATSIDLLTLWPRPTEHLIPFF